MLQSVVFHTKANYYFYSLEKKYFIPVDKSFHDTFYDVIELSEEKYLLKYKKIFPLDVLTKNLHRIKHYIEYGLIYSNKITESNEYKKVNNNSLYHNYLNCNELIFEVTQKCQLKCTYCYYNPTHTENSSKNDLSITFETAKVVLDEKIEYWKNLHGGNKWKHCTISFYGCEPLLNFPVIKKIVEYVKKNNLKNIHITYTMPTNAILLDRYMDFLAKHNFVLSINLDGDKIANKNRVFKNGKESFEIVKKNCDALKQKYPKYFDTSVSFTSFLSNIARTESIDSFFLATYKKTTNMKSRNFYDSPINKNTKYKNIYENLEEHVAQLFFEKNSDIKGFYGYNTIKGVFIDYFEHYYKSYSNVLGQLPYIPKNHMTTLFPKKILICRDGKILFFEKGLPHFMLGAIENNKVRIDFDSLTDEYKKNQINRNNICAKCFTNSFCNRAIKSDFVGNCRNFSTKETFSADLGRAINLIEVFPRIWKKTLELFLYGEV